MNAEVSIDADAALRHLAQRASTLLAELALRDAIIEAQAARIAELEQQLEPAPNGAEAPEPAPAI